MIVITIRFLAGAFHATPWGRDVNEGLPEWPPSPWRLLRAIISTWKTTLPELKNDDVLPIIQKLSSKPPEYCLPDASVSHTRHYVPTDKKPLILDTFVVVGNKPTHVIWKKVDLDPSEIESLEKILKNLHYLGRAESWCVTQVSTKPCDANCSPWNELVTMEDRDLVSVLVPNKDIDFTDQSNSTVSKKPNLRSISITTTELQDNNYIDPPGGKWIQYTIPKNCFVPKNTNNTKTSLMNNVTLARYAIVGTMRPSIRDTLRVGDLARSACMSIYGKSRNGDVSATFSGKDDDGNPLQNHRHAFYLPTYETQEREIDHLTIIASGTFNKHELDVLLRLDKLYSYNMPAVHLVFQGFGTTENFSGIPILEKSKVWASATPLILTRHIKYRQKGGNVRVIDHPREQIYNELKNRYGSTYKPVSISIDTGPTNMLNTNIKPYDFFRWRSHGSVGSSHAYNVRLEFHTPVKGPITLGYSSHFGLGMFVPQGDDE